jgi:hypothetical protein
MCGSSAVPKTRNQFNKWATIDQLFEMPSLRDFLKAMRPEFMSGQLVISLIAGDNQIAISPEQIKTLRSLQWKNWPDLLLPQMYENPQTDFPPLRKPYYH